MRQKRLPAAKRMASQLSQGSPTAMAEAKRLIDMSRKAAKRK